MTKLVNTTLSQDPIIVADYVNCFYDKVGKYDALTNVKSDRGFKSWPGHEVKPPDYHSSLEVHGQLDYQSPATYLGDEQDVTHPRPGSFGSLGPQRSPNWFLWERSFHQNKKRRRPREERCHTKSMMSTQANERLKYTLSMYRLGRTRREKYKGRS